MRLRDDVDRLARVIDAILLLSAPPRAHAGDSVVNLADLVRELAPRETTVDAPDEALVEADARLCSLAITNLLENAEKYSGHPARAVRVTREGDGVRVAVRDDGPGLAIAAREKMFDRYWRGAGDGEGSGLGLALVRGVAERHGGLAEARENPEGSGLEVSMTFARLVEWSA